jgi:hypothetical protein
MSVRALTGAKVLLGDLMGPQVLPVLCQVVVEAQQCFSVGSNLLCALSTDFCQGVCYLEDHTL